MDRVSIAYISNSKNISPTGIVVILRGGSTKNEGLALRGRP